MLKESGIVVTFFVTSYHAELHPEVIQRMQEELNMIPVLWTIDPLEWCSSNVGCITNRVVDKAGENEIILMHNYYDTSVTAALKVMDELLEEKYVFVTVEEILFE